LPANGGFEKYWKISGPQQIFPRHVGYWPPRVFEIGRSRDDFNRDVKITDSTGLAGVAAEHHGFANSSQNGRHYSTSIH
jgi:hypothetical protein